MTSETDPLRSKKDKFKMNLTFFFFFYLNHSYNLNRAVHKKARACALRPLRSAGEPRGGLFSRQTSTRRAIFPPNLHEAGYFPTKPPRGGLFYRQNFHEAGFFPTKPPRGGLFYRQNFHEAGYFPAKFSTSGPRVGWSVR